MHKNHFLTTAAAVAVGVGLYTLIITLVPSINPANLVSSVKTPGT
jgi:hypothetical protein